MLILKWIKSPMFKSNSVVFLSESTKNGYESANCGAKNNLIGKVALL